MAAPRRLRLPVPTTIVTGALASGKTSLIAALLRSKPPGEEWAVLVNEFGAAGLDGALLEGEHQQGGGGGVRVRQLAGGCLCCALSNMTPLAIAQLLRAVKPDRLLIEPSGFGGGGGRAETRAECEWHRPCMHACPSPPWLLVSLPLMSPGATGASLPLALLWFEATPPLCAQAGWRTQLHWWTC